MPAVPAGSPLAALHHLKQEGPPFFHTFSCMSICLIGAGATMILLCHVTEDHAVSLSLQLVLKYSAMIQ